MLDAFPLVQVRSFLLFPVCAWKHRHACLTHGHVSATSHSGTACVVLQEDSVRPYPSSTTAAAEPPHGELPPAALMPFPSSASAQVRKLADPRAIYTQLMEMLAQLAGLGLVHCDYNEFNILVRRVLFSLVLGFCIRPLRCWYLVVGHCGNTGPSRPLHLPVMLRR